jgi:hypothetical protein
VGGTADENDDARTCGEGSQLGRRVRPVLGYPPARGQEPDGLAIGTALAGSILIAFLTTSFLTGVQQNPAVPDSVKAQANVELAGGVPFISDADLQAALDQAEVSEEVATAALEANQQARLDGLRAALVVLALAALLALFSARRIPTAQPGSAPLPSA